MAGNDLDIVLRLVDQLTPMMARVRKNLRACLAAIGRKKKRFNYSNRENIKVLPLSAAEHIVLPPVQHEAVSQRELRLAIFKAMSTLSPRERQIVQARFGLSHQEPETHISIAARFGVSRERIKQIEQRALVKLRQPSRLKHLESWRYAGVRW